MVEEHSRWMCQSNALRKLRNSQMEDIKQIEALQSLAEVVKGSRSAQAAQRLASIRVSPGAYLALGSDSRRDR